MLNFDEKFKSPVRRRRGRRRSASNEIRNFWAISLYERWLPWLQARKRRMGLPDSPRVHWWQGPPHERAARMVAKRLRRNQSWRSVLNLVSRYR
jgi:hypothetical protein